MMNKAIDHAMELRVSDEAGKAPARSPRALDNLRLVFEQGGPGFAQFALNNACNANCGFCNFARDSFPKSQWKFADRAESLKAIDTLYANGVRYLLFTGGEPTLHPHVLEFTRHAHDLGMKVMLVPRTAPITGEMMLYSAPLTLQLSVTGSPRCT